METVENSRTHMSELRKTVAKDVWCDTSENLSNLFNKFGKIMD